MRLVFAALMLLVLPTAAAAQPAWTVQIERGEAALAADDLAVAQEAFEAAVEIERPKNQPSAIYSGNINMVWALNRLGTVQLRQARFGEAEAAFIEAIETAERALGFNSSGISITTSIKIGDQRVSGHSVLLDGIKGLAQARDGLGQAGSATMLHEIADLADSLIAWPDHNREGSERLADGEYDAAKDAFEAALDEADAIAAGTYGADVSGYADAVAHGVTSEHFTYRGPEDLLARSYKNLAEVAIANDKHDRAVTLFDAAIVHVEAVRENAPDRIDIELDAAVRIGRAQAGTAVGEAIDMQRVYARVLELALDEIEQNEIAGNHQARRAIAVLPDDADAVLMQWVEDHIDQIYAPILFELSARHLDDDRDAAYQWFFAGAMWAFYDVGRCTDPSATALIGVYSNWIKPAFERLDPDWYAANKERVNAAMARAFEWEKDNPSPMTPLWLCNGGIVAISQMLSGGSGPTPEELVRPEADWEDARARARQLTRNEFGND